MTGAIGKGRSLLRHHWVVLAAGVMVVVGLLGWTMTALDGHGTGGNNLALVDKQATAQVTKVVSRELTQVFSYDYNTPQATQRAAQALLSGQALKQFHTLFTTMKQKAPQQKLVLSTTVSSAGVRALDSDSAQLLVFLDQTSKRASDKQATVSAAQVSVKARKVDGHWKITGLELL